MAGQPRTRARKLAAAEEEAAKTLPAAAKKTSGRKPAAKKPAASSPRKPGRRGPDKPRFQPASDDDFAKILKGVDEAAGKEYKTAKDRVERDTAVIAAWALGLTPMTIAAKFRITSFHVSRIINAHRTRRAREPLPPGTELLHDALEALESQMERLSVAASREGASESAVVGAIRTWKEMWISRLELLQVMGAINQAPSADARLARARDLLRGLLDALHDEGVDQAAIDRAAARILHEGDDLTNLVTIEGRSTG